MYFHVIIMYKVIFFSSMLAYRIQKCGLKDCRCILSVYNKKKWPTLPSLWDFHLFKFQLEEPKQQSSIHPIHWQVSMLPFCSRVTWRMCFDCKIIKYFVSEDVHLSGYYAVTWLCICCHILTLLMKVYFFFFLKKTWHGYSINSSWSMFSHFNIPEGQLYSCIINNPNIRVENVNTDCDVGDLGLRE